MYSAICPLPGNSVYWFVLYLCCLRRKAICLTVYR
ncbi:hypothetical protein AKK42_22060 [Klebsiella quasipneumoniae]|nr:hypothetical protein AKK42_22060 [Klebsiella quasipneumoniae]KYZ72873.1 hypothetical protein A2G95_24365 [Klebsiella quasipneumoniae subsp. similipneumoniae]OON83186.1 hypothetical protein BU230_07650 [Klebsiella pneumoniae]ASR24048.1 hypothetical protein AWV58_23000 [Klebsiella quasipneumoniae]ASR28676.1 hypothetical protein AWV59_01780 [Klebsiella quasipneumoniae]